MTLSQNEKILARALVVVITELRRHDWAKDMDHNELEKQSDVLEALL